MDTNTRTAIESLRTFAVAQVSGFTPRECADRPHFSAFAHMCTAALNGEAWAVERVVDHALYAIETLSETTTGNLDTMRVDIIRRVDCTRPDGAMAKSFRP